MNRNRVFTYASLPLLLTPCQRHSDIGQSFCVWLNVIVTGMSVFCLHDTMSRFVCFITCIASDWVLSYIKAQGAFSGELSMEEIEESGAVNSNLIMLFYPDDSSVHILLIRTLNLSTLVLEHLLSMLTNKDIIVGERQGRVLMGPNSRQRVVVRPIPRAQLPSSVDFKYCVNDDVAFMSLYIGKRSCGRKLNIKSIDLPPLHPHGKRITKAKMLDLKSLLPFIPPVSLNLLGVKAAVLPQG